MKVYCETQRLILREITIKDADSMFEMDSDPEVHKYLGNNPVKSLDQIYEVIAFIQKQYLEYGVARWAVVRKEDNKFIGWCGLKFRNDEINGIKNFYDLGYRFNKKYWGQGYATESSIACLDYGFSKLRINVIYAMAELENIASNRVLEKLGMVCTNKVMHEGVENNWYEIKK